MTMSKRGAERASTAADLMTLPSTKTLRETWGQTLRAQESNAHVALATGERNRLHPCFDTNLGLNSLARAVLLRNVLKTEIRRDHREPPPDAPWQIAITNKSHAFDLFAEKALNIDPAGWLHVDADNTSTLYDLNWRKRLCDGFDGPARARIRGLNGWFGSRYQKNLPGGEMTARLLFETRFFGTNAIDNYIRFLLHGTYVPSANHTLSSAPPYSDLDLDRDPGRRAKLYELLDTVTCGDNAGRPIVTVSCEGNPTAGSRLATTLVSKLGDRMRSACYIPLARQSQKGQLNDHGYRSIVEVIHRFINGESSLTCSAREHGEAELALMVRQVRAHIVTVPTVFVLDGFSPGMSAFPALISFIRDEPIDRILRFLQHPDTGDWRGRTGGDTAAFRQTYFVVIGTPARRWMEMHRQSTVELQFTMRDENDVLGRVNMSALKESLRPYKRQQGAEPWAHNEWQLNAMSFLARNGPLPEGDDPQNIVQTLFNRYWNDSKLKSWQKLFLRALALSESGLRWSTSVQIIEAYARMRREPGATNEDHETNEAVGAEVFKSFIDEACAASKSAPMLFEYGDGPEADSYDIFDFPSQAVSRLADGHPWITARAQKKERWLQTVDYFDIAFKRLVRATITPNEEFIIRRILAELCLQNFRVRLRHTRTTRRIDRRTSRNLAEALLHGMMSIEPPDQPSTDGEAATKPPNRRLPPALPKFTQGEIPADPAAAFSFLYSAVFVDLFCGGDPTGIAQTHGNGELQLEMLMLMCGATPVGAADHAIVTPNTSVCAPLWWGDGRPASLHHLFSIARSAKRAGRVEILGVALDRLEKLHSKQPLEGLYLLVFRKLCIGHTLLASDGSRKLQRLGAMQREQVLRAVVAFARKPSISARWEESGRALLRILRQLKLEVRHQVQEHHANRLVPQDIDKAVDKACKTILKILPARKLPREALTLLTRMAWLESVAGDQLQRQGQTALAFQRNIAAMAFFWLGKSLALCVRKDNANTSPRVDFSATKGYVRTVLKLKEYLAAQDGGESSRFRDRLYKSTRSMLDTYAREQAVHKADHIAAAVLECTYVRTTLQRTALLAKMVRPDLPTGDERLTSLSRCLQWLRNAEHEMLSFSGQPAMRVMLCRERVLCVTEMLNRLSEHLSIDKIPIKRKLDESDGVEFRPLVDMLINDLRQYSHYTNFMKSYSPGARFVVDEWTQDRDYLLSVIKACAEGWRAREAGPYNQSLDLLTELS